jgi:hypothetical protein
MPIIIKKGGATARSAPVVQGALKPDPPPPPPKARNPLQCPYCFHEDGKQCDRVSAKKCFRGLYLRKLPPGSR